jgi:hemoglobin-like flavoprotein
MTPKQKQLVQASFARLAPSADAVAEMFYRELFVLDPTLRELFKSDLAEQGRKLVSMLGTAIANLDRLESIAPAVRDLGCRHAGYGVKPADYETVARALIATLEQGLGSDFTPALREAWASCYRALAGEMMAGAEKCKGCLNRGLYLGFTEMARLSSRFERMWIGWHGPSTRRLVSSETVIVGQESILCKLALSPSRRWSLGAESVLGII